MSEATSQPSVGEGSPQGRVLAEGWRLRDYQQQAVDATLRHFRRSGDPACLVLPTGAGKSLIIAELCRLARGKVLVLAHVKELCEQNYDKFQRCGLPGGLFSAGLGQRRANTPVTFATVQSVARHLGEFEDPHSLVIVDECHRVSLERDSQYGQVIAHLRRHNSSLKVLGLTATPYRLGMGWVYQVHHRGLVRSDEPRPFGWCVWEVALRQLIEQKYLTPPRLIDAPTDQYDFSSLQPDQDGRVADKQCNELLGKHRRVTRAIVEQVQRLGESRRGVMIFAATVQHAREVMSYLPQSEAVLVLGDTPSAERAESIERFKAQQVKYLVNVAVLTTGFDAPHVDFIALLRPSQSVGLLQQMVGRGLRLSEGKEECLVVDYAGSGLNILSPEVGAPRPDSSSVPVEVVCPQCEFVNSFWGHVDASGHCTEHYGRRCHALIAPTPSPPAGPEPSRRAERCSYRFRFKECERCGEQCDIAARSCANCRHALVDPDDQLRRALGLKDARVLRVAGLCCAVDGHRLKVVYHDEEGSTLSESFDFQQANQRAVFFRIFQRRLPGAPRSLGASLAEVQSNSHHLVSPQFVIARKTPKKYWRVQTRIFDYEGRYRTANQL